MRKNGDVMAFLKVGKKHQLCKFTSGFFISTLDVNHACGSQCMTGVLFPEKLSIKSAVK